MNTEPNETSASAASEPSAHGPVSPGSLIREARQAARLSVDDLAAHTKLARTTVEALERDDFGALLEPVYVRGYYRKCAKVLNLNEKTLIDAYAARVTQKIPQPPAKLRLASGTELGSSSRLPMTMGILFVIVGVAVCAFLWWVRGATTAVPQILSTPVTTSISDTSGTPVEVTPPPAASGSTAASQAGPDTAAAVPPPAASATPAPAAAAPAVSGDTPAAVVPSPSTATASNVPVVPSGSGPLLVTFTGQSWIRVSDADGRTLLNGLVAAGERRRLDGKPPFDLFIGAAHVVGVEFQGKAIDLKPYTRDNATARLSLPLPAATP